MNGLAVLTAQQGKLQIGHLSDVMMQVSGAAQKDVKSVSRIIFSQRRVRPRPVFFRLLANGATHIGDSFVKALHDFRFGRTISLGELSVAIPHITGACDLRADVILQITGQVKDEMSETVSKRERLLPELLVAERRRQLPNQRSKHFITFGKP